MAKDKLSDYDGVTAGNNTDIGGISIDEGMLPSTVNNSLRELTKQLGAFADGTDGIDVLNLHDDDASASIKIQAPATVTTTTTLTLPDGAGSNGQILTTNGSGTLSWTSAGAGYSGWTISDGTNSENVADGDTLTVSGSGATTASYNTSTNTLTISSTDTDTTYSNATTSVAGLMSSADKTKMDGIESGATADQTASEILTAIKTVDGSGSGLDADTLDGQQGSYYYPASNPNGYTTNVGDITGVTAGTGLSGGGASGSVTLNVDLSELTDMTASMVGTDEFIVLDAGADRRKAANEIGLSIFSNDAGFTTNVGDITGVTAGTNLTGGGTSGTVTINMATGGVGAGTYGSTSNQVKIDTITVDAYGRVTAVATGDTGDITSVTAGTGMSGGGTSGAVTLNNTGVLSVNGVTGAVSASDLLTAIKTVDGAGSGLDADTVDGLSSGSFIRADATDTGTGAYSTSGTYWEIGDGTGGVAMTTNDGYGNANLTFNHRNGVPDNNGSACRIETNVDSTTGGMSFEVGNNVTSGTAVGLTTAMTLTTSTQTLYYNGNSRISTSSAGATVNGALTATSFSGDGSGLTGIQAGAGYFLGENGATGDTTNGKGDIFRVHEDTLNTSVTIPSGNNALCASPLTIATGVTLTVNGNLSIV